jgi:hypothetical protein
MRIAAGASATRIAMSQSSMNHHPPLLNLQSNDQSPIANRIGNPSIAPRNRQSAVDNRK